MTNREQMLYEAALQSAADASASASRIARELVRDLNIWNGHRDVGHLVGSLTSLITEQECAMRDLRRIRRKCRRMMA